MKAALRKEFDIRYTTVLDGPSLRQWILALQHWFPVSTDREIDDACQCWIGFSRYSASLTATLEGRPCGMATLFLMPYRKVAHQALFKVIVSPEYQRQGIGTALVRNLKHLAKEYFRLSMIHTEIYENNPLEVILLSQGFSEYARQEKYVKQEGKYLARILYEIVL